MSLVTLTRFKIAGVRLHRAPPFIQERALFRRRILRICECSCAQRVLTSCDFRSKIWG